MERHRHPWDLEEHSEDWWDGHDIGKEENLENIAFFFGILLGIPIGIGIYHFFGGLF